MRIELMEHNKQCSQFPVNGSEEDSKILDDGLLSAGIPFKTLIDSSSTVQGGHFQFKNEKLWTINNSDADRSSSIFKINLGSIAENLSNINFDERLVRTCGCSARSTGDDSRKYSSQRSETLIEEGRQKSRMFNEYMTLAERMDELDERFAQLMKDKSGIPKEKDASTSIISARSELLTLSNECDSANNKVPFSNVKNNQAQEPPKQKKDENNLEDWLDSILDK